MFKQVTAFRMTKNKSKLLYFDSQASEQDEAKDIKHMERLSQD